IFYRIPDYLKATIRPYFLLLNNYLLSTLELLSTTISQLIISEYILAHTRMFHLQLVILEGVFHRRLLIRLLVCDHNYS
ncbi:hypothetical protein BDW71DRAFT_193137, partial [Aspergillus fruticulosus]